MVNTILGVIAFLCAIGGLLASSKATLGIAVICAPYVMFKVSYCFRMLEIQEKNSDNLGALVKCNKQIAAAAEVKGGNS